MRAIVTLLTDLGISANYKGFFYLCSALRQLEDSSPSAVRVTKDIYPTIAKEFKTTPQNVEQGIATVLATCWQKGNRDLLCELCFCVRKPTITVFIQGLLTALYLVETR